MSRAGLKFCLAPWFGLLLELVCAAASFAQEPPGTTLNLVDVPLETLIEITADATGRRFYVDPAVRGSVTMFTSTPKSSNEVLEALVAVLCDQGFRAIAQGNDIRVVPKKDRTADSTQDEPDQVIAAAVPYTPPPSNSDVLRRAVSPVTSFKPSRDLELQPEQVDGVLRGYRIHPRGAAVELNRLGVDAGDLIIDIDGTALNDPARAKHLIDRLLAPGTLVRLERGGRSEYLRMSRERSSMVFPGMTENLPPLPANSTPVELVPVITARVTRFSSTILNGKPHGVRVFPNHVNNPWFIEQGLRPGDVVTTVNGVRLDTAENGMQLFAATTESSQPVNVEVERNGQTLQLTLRNKRR